MEFYLLGQLMNGLKIDFAIIDEFYLILNGNSVKENTLFSIYGANVFEKRVKKYI